MRNIDVIDREENPLVKQWLTITYLQLICFGVEIEREKKNV